MTKQVFKLDGIKGVIFADGWIQWATISCHISGLADCGLKQVAIKALTK